ncbi:hypothetical protein [Kitasatospora azatica]|uniref:hypothetical protein n=1 Tax=Kitasatospora azatica TaxID=58347 RepID=UPI00055DBA6F|nr:hypothetical protein [Kitasatospora azatica]
MDPRRDSRPSEFRTELDAALQTRKELGPEYETELVDSFLSRIDARLDARVEQRVAERLAEHGPLPRPGRDRERRRGWGGKSLPAMSLVFAIPLTAIASSPGHGSGLSGMLVCWAGIVGVNFAAAFADRREQREQREEKRRAARSEWA